jgi:hypothetical protein
LAAWIVSTRTPAGSPASIARRADVVEVVDARHAAGGERGDEIGDLRAEPAQHGERAPRHAAGVELGQARGEVRRLGGDIVMADDRDGRARTAHGDQLAEGRGLRSEHGARADQHRLRAAVAPRQHAHLTARRGVRAQLRRRAAPAVDRLQRIADGEVARVRRDERAEEAELARLAVLELVDEHVLRRRSLVGEERRRVLDQLVEVQRASRAPLGGDRGCELGERRIRGEPVAQRGSPSRLDAQPSRDGHRELDRLLVVEDREAPRGAAEQGARHAVERADQPALAMRGGSPEQRVEPRAELVGGAVGERHDRDPLERHAADEVEVGRAVDEDRGLAAADLRAHEGLRLGREHRRALIRIERAQPVLEGHGSGSLGAGPPSGST